MEIVNHRGDGFLDGKTRHRLTSVTSVVALFWYGVVVLL
jgi:hypothetical protein